MTVASDHVVNHGNYERIACIVFCAVTPVFVIARCWSRLASKQFGADDWAAIAAFLFVLASTVQTLVAFNYGWGHHVKDLDPRDLKICMILHWTFQITYKLSVASNKASILLLYKRILVQRTYRIIIWSLLTLIILFAISTTIAGVFQCVPVNKAWDKKLKGHCYNLVDAWYSNAVFSIVTDILILLLPMHMVWTLQVKARQKILLAGMFGLGSFVTFTSIMRFFALKAAASADSTYDINSGFWSVIEINVGVICVSLPPLRAVLARYFPFLRGTLDSTGNASSGQRYNKYGPRSSGARSADPLGRRARHSHILLEDDNEMYAVHGATFAPAGAIKKETEVVVAGRDIESGRRTPSDEIEINPFGHQNRRFDYEGKVTALPRF